MLSYALSFVAGLLTVLSPCVLPALPMIVGSAAQDHRHAPLALGLGLVFSFTFVGVALASAGSLFGFDASSIRTLGALVMTLFGVVLVAPRLQEQSSSILLPFANWGNLAISRMSPTGFRGHFFMGCALGSVWSPCSGPTLGAAIGIASQRGGLIPATAGMLLFGLGATSPLLFLAYGSQRVFSAHKQGLIAFAKSTKIAFGVISLAVGLFTLLNLDKAIEAKAIELLPDSWTNLTTRY